jgi:hypothetical protein
MKGTWSRPQYLLVPGPYCPLGTIGTVPRAYDIFRAYKGMGEKIKIKNGK